VKYKFRLTQGKTTLAFSDKVETLERLREVMELPEAEISSTKSGPREVVWAGSRTPIQVGGK
jgi:hypothetical protein